MVEAVGPAKAVLRLHDERKALIVHIASTQKHVQAAVLTPHLGVAHMAAAEVRIVCVVQQHLLFAQVKAIGGFDENLIRLAAGVDVVMGARAL